MRVRKVKVTACLFLTALILVHCTRSEDISEADYEAIQSGELFREVGAIFIDIMIPGFKNYDNLFGTISDEYIFKPRI